MSKLFKIIFLTALFFNIFCSAQANTTEFNLWIKKFEKLALSEGISQSTINETIYKSKFLPKVIEYDRFQPEFYEDTLTYVNKRSNKKKVKKGISLYYDKKNLIDEVQNKFLIEKELLLALMGIETNFGNYLGKMDIISSLATLSFDKRRSNYFTKELLVLLKLIDSKIIDKDILYGSWAGAFGNFQFMPSTIKNYALAYNKNTLIELKDTDDSFASAANYLNKIGWKKNKPCFYKIDLKKNIPQKFLNTSAKKIINKKEFKFFKQYILNPEKLNIPNKTISAIITPDQDIIPSAKKIKPAYIVFNNYELILKWNRSLRFALAVCTLKEKIKNEI